MPLYLSGDIDSDSSVYIAPLTSDKIESLGDEVVDTSGYFLFCKDRNNPQDITILARAVSEDAALNLARMLNLR